MPCNVKNQRVIGLNKDNTTLIVVSMFGALWGESYIGNRELKDDKG